MLNLIGAAMVLAGSAGIGVLTVRRLKGRVAALRSLTGALNILEQELSFALPPMAQLLTNTARRAAEPAAAFLFTCAEEIKKSDERTLAEIWTRAAEEKLPQLKACDLELLLAAGSVMGRYDADRQGQMISAVRHQLAARLEQAEGERSKNGKVYGALSAAAGLFWVIMFL